MEYLNSLKVAVINKDLDKLKEVVNMQPVFNSLDEAKEIQAYLNEAVKILKEEKEKLSKEMKKIKNLQKFNEQKDQETFNFKA